MDADKRQAAELLAQEAGKFEIELSETQISKLLAFGELVMEGNKRLNLTGKLDWPTYLYKHVLDSLSVLLYVEVAGKVLDVGTGAGFPGVPLAIARPDLHVTLLDSLRKRIEFLENACSELDLPVELVWSRAEDFGRSQGREQYQLVTSRAVAKLPVLLELCLPHVAPGGLFAAYKGPDVEEEMAEAGYALEELGGELVQMPKIQLPQGYGTRHLLLIKKVRPTPQGYPRRAGLPEKKPLLGRNPERKREHI